MYTVTPSEPLSAATKKKLLKVADFLETVPRRQFDISNWAEIKKAPDFFKEGQNKVKKIDDIPVSCGTTACICGWLPTIFPNRGLYLSADVEVQRDWEGNEKDKDVLAVDLCRVGSESLGEDAAAEFLGIPHEDARNLFVESASYEPYEEGSTRRRRHINTPKQAAKMIRNYVEAAG